MLEVQDVSRRFGSVKAVSSLSFALDRPGVLALLGANGAGKTTTMRILTGALRPHVGTVRIGRDRRDPANPDARRRVGFLSEHAAPYPEMTPLQFLRYRARLYRVPPAERGARTEEAIARCELDAVRNRRIGALSKGYRQRVGLAAALLHRPDLLVLDEPTSGLDPRQTAAFRALLAEIAADRAVVLSTHILAEVEAVAHRVIVLAAGRLVHDGPVHETDPAFREVDLTVSALGGGPIEHDAARLAGLLLASDSVARVTRETADPPGLTAGAPRWHRLRIALRDPTRDPGVLAAIARRVTNDGRSIATLTPVRVGFEERFMSFLDPAHAAEDVA